MKMEMSTEDMTLSTVPEPPLILENTKEGYLTRAHITTTGTTVIRYTSFAPGMCTLKFGPHPIAQQLRAIGLRSSSKC